MTTEFSEIIQTYHDRIRFFGNVEIGTDISLSDLQANYDGVICAAGAQGDKRLDIPGKEARGIYTAKQFVMWYNGHPEHLTMPADFYRILQRPKVNVSILGQGNVALDCARILLTAQHSPEKLRKSDMPRHVYETLTSARIGRCGVIGRRGSAQASFTNKELREFSKYQIPASLDHKEIELSMKSQASLEELQNNRGKTRSLEILRKMDQLKDANVDSHLALFFLQQPTLFQTDADNFVSTLQTRRTHLVGEAHHQKSVLTDTILEHPTDLVLESVGFNVLPIEGCLFSNGRCVHDKGHQNSNLFVVGWFKRGPRGVIASNIACAAETAETVTDFLQGNPGTGKGRIWIDRKLQMNRVAFTTFKDWKRIEKLEQIAGHYMKKCAEKIQRIAEFSEKKGI